MLDGDGIPVKEHDSIPIAVVGSDGSLQDEVVIPTGRSYVTLSLEGLQPASQLELWFVNLSLTSAHLSVQSLTLPTSVQVTAPETPLFPGDRMHITARVLSSGNPLPQAKLAWTATNGTLSDTTLETDENGEGQAVFVARDPGDGIIEITATKVGFEESRAQANVAVVAAIEPDKSSPRVLGIPAWFLFLAIPAGLLGYLLYKFLPPFKGRQT